MRSADVFFYAGIGLALVGVAIAAWIGNRQPKLPIPRRAIYALIWLGVLGLLTTYYMLRGSNS